MASVGNVGPYEIYEIPCVFIGSSRVGRHWEASGGTLETSGRHLEVSGRHLDASGRYVEAPGRHGSSPGGPRNPGNTPSGG